MTLEQGILEGTGFGWVRASRAVEQYSKPKQPVTDTTIVVMEETLLADKAFMHALEHTPWALVSRVGHIGFQPVDAGALFPGERVRYAIQRHAFDFGAWAATQVEVPPGIDLGYEYSPYATSGHVLSAVARTMRKGKIVNVRRPVGADVPFKAAMAEIIEDFARTCPAPDGDADGPTTGEHVAALLRMVSVEGREVVERWLASDAEKRRQHGRGSRYDGSTMHVPGEFLIGAGVATLALTTTSRSSGVRAKATLEGGHEIEDDETGTTVTLRAQLPETVVAAMRGRTLGDVVGEGWLDRLRIRTVPKPTNGTLVFRAFSENVPFAIGEGIVPDGEEVDRRLAAVCDVDPDARVPNRWHEMDVALVPVLGSMDAFRLSTVLAEMGTYGAIDLTPHGHPGWVVRGQGARIVADQQPAVPMTALPPVAALAAREGRENREAA